MSMSLRDQLLAAGLGTRQQAKNAREQQHQQARRKGGPAPQQNDAAQRAQAEKAERDRELNRRQQAKTEAKALRAQIRQWVEQDKLPAIESDESFSFIDGGKVRRVAVDANRRGQLARGEVVLVRNKGHYEQLPAAAAVRIRERDATAVVSLDAAAAPVDANDPYKDFAVPDDLVW
jgi:uncharacterized protein YaiL (DUF2058 family)